MFISPIFLEISLILNMLDLHYCMSIIHNFMCTSLTTFKKRFHCISSQIISTIFFKKKVLHSFILVKISPIPKYKNYKKMTKLLDNLFIFILHIQISWMNFKSIQAKKFLDLNYFIFQSKIFFLSRSECHINPLKSVGLYDFIYFVSFNKAPKYSCA